MQRNDYFNGVQSFGVVLVCVRLKVGSSRAFFEITLTSEYRHIAASDKVRK